MKRYSLFLIIITVIAGIVACQRDDDEPAKEARSISRLYISTSDYDGNGGNNYYNVYVVDPADSNVFPPYDSIYKFTSGARGGNYINYSPLSEGLIFQGSQNGPSYLDTAVQVMSVSPTGVLKNTGRIATRKLDRVRGIFYTVVSEVGLSDAYLLILNASDTLGSTLFAVNRPASQGSYTRPRYHLPLDYNPWGITISERNVFVTKIASTDRPTAKNGIVVYKNFTTKFLANTPDSLMTNVARYDLDIKGANNVRGITYAKDRDLLVVTDYEGEGLTSKGRILFFEGFSTYTTNEEITPTRIITSAVLKQPMDVAIDSRTDGKYIYVADPIAKRVFRFLIDDVGDIEPNISLNLNGRSPQSISLDAR